MAIVKMRRLNLVAMAYDKDAVLNALHRTGAVEVVEHADTENTVTIAVDTEEQRAYLASVETALSALCGALETAQKESGETVDALANGFDVTYSEFSAAKEKKDEADELVRTVNGLTDEKNALLAELYKTEKEKQQAAIYAKLTLPFSAFMGTAHTNARLGLISVSAQEKLQTAFAEQSLCAYQTLATDADNALVYVVAHKSVSAETDGILSGVGFFDCPYEGTQTGVGIYRTLCEKEATLKEQLTENGHTMYVLKDKIRFLKVYCDALTFGVEKADVSGKLRATESTFLLQAYVPEDAEEAVKAEIKETTQVAYMEFVDPTDEETPPTLLRNNSLVSNFEPITNTYSAPNYREFDPNAVMAFFYSLFMGFIIGDAGYGFLMAAVGGFLWWKHRAKPTGMSKLAGAFAVGGVFAMIWGLLFNSVFGLSLLSATLMPNPQKDMWTLAGISVPSVLIISMEIGVSQIIVGYICKAVQEWRRGNIADGICDGVIWVLFSIGVGLAIVGFVDEAQLPILATVGGITAGGSLLLAMLTAGRKEKFFGKFTKGFGAAYGVINFASDILSYARLYGLMLSGAVIAQIIAQYGGQFLLSGNALLIVLGVVILLVGHGFNLVMNLLGAYIHDARLQYVEFYGRFFEGEGELFKPLGSENKYIRLQPSGKSAEKAKR
ncbi:MAG: V-type ATP synthase subunit I [Clostridia bacterium]|nr:V-type ATP synthase subunit I [Clostridia bacterium]